MKQLRKTKPVLQDRVRRIVFPKRPVHRSQEIKVLLNLEPTGIKSDIFICIVRFKTAHIFIAAGSRVPRLQASQGHLEHVFSLAG